MAGQQFKVDTNAISFGQRMVSTSLKFALSESKPENHVGRIWKDLSNRRLIGRLILGDDQPEQQNFAGRSVIEGAFDTHKPGFSEDHATLKISFDGNEIDLELLLTFKYKTCWIQIDSIEEIPEEEKTPAKKKEKQWRDEKISVLGFSGVTGRALADSQIATVGEMVDVIEGKAKLFDSIDSILTTPARAKKAVEKTALWLETNAPGFKLDILETAGA